LGAGADGGAVSAGQPPRVGVFDSGVGGLSVLAALRGRLPGAIFAYCSDNAHFPYGTRAEDDVVECVHTATSAFIQRCGLDLLVLACNTASTVALPKLRSTFTLPVVGVVPAIKPAAQASRTRAIGLLATPGTVLRPYIDELIEAHAAHCRVVRAGSSRLVEVAEAKLRGKAVDKGVLRAEIAPLFAEDQPGQARIDVVVLGCTHFPLLATELAAAAPWPVRWVDSSEAVAARTAYLLLEKGMDATKAEPGAAPVPTVYLTGDDPARSELAKALAALGLAGPERL
jgi:glutamate racemase